MSLPKLPPDSKPLIRKESSIVGVMIAFAVVILAIGIWVIIKHCS